LKRTPNNIFDKKCQRSVLKDENACRLLLSLVLTT